MTAPDLIAPSSFLKPFPAPEDVFAEPVAQHARHLHPLCSIDLQAVNPAWRGWIHMLSPVEPEDGWIGAGTEAWHNAYLRANWLALRLAGDRYTLLGDWNYFALECPATSQKQRAALEHLHEDEHAIFARVRVHFLENRQRLWPRREGRRNLRDPVTLNLLRKQREIRGFDTEGEPFPLLAQLGGGAPDGNWASDGGAWPLDRTTDPAHPAPLTPDGRRFEFVAQVPAWNYGLSGADSILLFYDPIDSVALFTFDY